MRDELGETDPNVIEFVEVDPAAFGSADPPLDPALPQRARSRWRVAVAAAGAVAVIGSALLVWRPWHDDADQHWSSRLVVDSPGNDVTEVAIDRAWFFGAAAEVGFVFAEPGAALPFLRGGRDRSATWTSFAVDSIGAATTVLGASGTPLTEVQGVPAEVGGVSGSVVRIGFGPLAGRMYQVTTNQMTKEAAVRFAGSIGVERGAPVLRDTTVLQGMQPLGTSDEFNAALSLLGTGFYAPTTIPSTTVAYGAAFADDGFVRVSSIADDTDSRLLTMAELVLGASPGRTVHGHPALAIDVRALTNNDQEADSIVAWHEHGRFIVVSGLGDVEATLAMAETTHPATEAEWAPIAAQATEPDSGFPATIGFLRADDGALTGVSATFDPSSGLQICLDDRVRTDDDCAHEGSSQLPLLTVMRIHTESFIVALVGFDAKLPELQIERAGGVVDTHLLFRPGDDIPGPAVAVFVPDDMREATLVVDGEVVATL